MLLGHIRQMCFLPIVLTAEGAMGLAIQPRLHMIPMVTTRVQCTPPAQDLFKRGFLTERG